MPKLKYSYWEELKPKTKEVIIPTFRRHKHCSVSPTEFLSNKEIKELADRLRLASHGWCSVFASEPPTKGRYRSFRSEPFYCKLEKEKMQLDLLNWIKFGREELQKEEIEELDIFPEYDYFHLELDEAESEAFIKMLNEPKPNAEKYRKEAEEMFKHINIHTDPIRLKMKKPKK